ncbi:pyridoxine pyridoxamine 5 -phosphate oxidase chloroplastic-like [Chlorella sorokiniana]|uniref:NAD(P)H-hydrate epimerase n=1 Tax=Chlorella sorokiniana TaxID=3076 RepID=A0A2P6TK29_CHLSO|nr:pyridoxine pyridoxamine 5 -phosphate oxidase chloroplastic-like [Chlorella sorokiniana]|eukprot:PRW44444.1 pyridoxine pyridoxamine 5 -phosphate oxidase chloroplastic-like [Chlorella sorokiniana]
MEGITYLTQKEAQSLDEELMGPLGFSVDQLMELAGLSVASAAATEYPTSTHPRVLVVAGPGNNGGDGLVAARHLHHFGYQVTICYPKPTSKPLYDGLVTQCRSLGIPFMSAEELAAAPLSSKYDVVLDAMFGFSFQGAPRPPFDAIIEMLKPGAHPPPVVAVDIPSGWNVEAGDESGGGLRPDMLVSLTAPKLCAKQFAGSHHYLGGRFVPPQIKEKYKLNLPPYLGVSQCVRIGGSGRSPAAGPANVADMRLSYGSGGQSLDESDMAEAGPMQEFDAWFKLAASSGIQEPNAMSLATATVDGRPSVRYVLLKGYDERGFVWYTNYDSTKGKHLEENSVAGLAFWWEPLQRQVRVEGVVEKVPDEESDAYFYSRPRGHQIGALVSMQSTPLHRGRAELEERAARLERQYADESVPVPRPPHWGGFILRPLSVEFWQGRPSRLHDRLRYVRSSVDSNEWRLERLAP